MEDIDLSGVDPRRWPEIRRRVQIINEFIALGRHTGAQRDEFAARMGRSPNHFMRLVAIWKEHRDATRLDGAKIRRGAPNGQSRGMPRATRQAVLDAITAMGSNARFVDVATEAGRRCRNAGTRPASAGMIHYMLMRARKDCPPAAGETGVIIGRVACRLPMSVDSHVMMPALLIAVSEPSGTIVAHALVENGDTTDALKSVMTGLAAEPRTVSGPVPVTITKALAALLDLDALPTGGSDTLLVGPTGGAIARLLGSYVGGIAIRHRGTPAFTMSTTFDAPLDRSEAKVAVDVAVRTHNSARAA